MKSSLSAALAGTLLISCSTNTPLNRTPGSSKVSESEPYFWIEGFERPLNLLRVKDAGELHAAWSRTLEPNASLPKHSPPYLEPNEEVSPKDLEQALEFMLPKLRHALDRTQGGEFRDEDVGELLQVAEVHRALELNFKDPVRRKQSVEFELVKKLTEFGAHTMLQGKYPAINAEGADDPANSSFWTRPQDISKLDLRIGFGRKFTLATEVRNQGKPCAFDEAKTGYGTKPGFTVKCGATSIKVKFRELRSEPFATRIFWALGYNVDPVDHVSELDFTYGAEFFTQINNRKNLAVELTALGVITAHRIQLTQNVDPFTLLKRAKLTDGKSIDAAELKARLVKNPKADLLALEESDLNGDFAKRIAALTTVEAQLQAKNKAVDRIGPWQWEDFNHPFLRETRGLLAAAAWLGWYDCRFDNNRLAFVKNASGETELRHFMTDLGAVLGFSSGFFTNEYEKPEQMEDSVISKAFFTGVKIINYRTLNPNRAFEEATDDDLRWGASWLNRISDQQIHDAAIGAGFDEVRAKVIVQKLHNRLYNMNRHLK